MKTIIALAVALAFVASPVLAESKKPNVRSNMVSGEYTNVPTGVDVKGCNFNGYADPNTGVLYPAIDGPVKGAVIVCVFPRTYPENVLPTMDSGD